MYEFVEIDGGWRIYWGPPAAQHDGKPTPPEKAVILPFVQVEIQRPTPAELELAVAA